MFAGPLGRSTFTPPKSSFDSPLYGLVSLRRSQASTTAPAGPDDVVGRAIKRVGGNLERFMAPVEPGNLLLLAYVGDVPIVAAPGCFRSPRPNVVDLVLPALLTQHRLTGADIAAFGHGGLLQ